MIIIFMDGFAMPAGMENEEWKMEDGGWRMEDGQRPWGSDHGEDEEWRMEDGGWRMEDGG
jgi:hypothetical protein